VALYFGRNRTSFEVAEKLTFIKLTANIQ